LNTTAASPGPNASSVMSAVYVNPPLARAGWHTNTSRRPESTWYHVDMMLPARAYRPTTGTWNWLVEWHDDPHTAPSSSGPYSIALGIYTGYPVVAGKVGVDPKLVLRMAGGSARHPTYQGLVSPIRVRYDHWYSLTFHFVWSDSAKTGAVQWFVDGRLTASEHFPTLYANPDGTMSYNSFGVYNYHLTCPWPSTVDFGGIAIGPTRMSVGRARPTDAARARMSAERSRSPVAPEAHRRR
jgi:Polysaccharide lyase